MQSELQMLLSRPIMIHPPIESEIPNYSQNILAEDQI